MGISTWMQIKKLDQKKCTMWVKMGLMTESVYKKHNTWVNSYVCNYSCGLIYGLISST